MTRRSQLLPRALLPVVPWFTVVGATPDGYINMSETLDPGNYCHLETHRRSAETWAWRSDDMIFPYVQVDIQWPSICI